MLELHEIVHLLKHMEFRMATLEDQVSNMVSTLNSVAVAIGNIQTPPAPVVDFTPVTTAITALGAEITNGLAALQADLDTQLAAISAQFQTTPVAPVAPAPTAT